MVSKCIDSNLRLLSVPLQSTTKRKRKPTRCSKIHSEDGKPWRTRDANSAGIAAEAAPFTNADVLAKALLKIKLILDIEKALRTISTSEAPEILDPFKIRF